MYCTGLDIYVIITSDKVYGNRLNGLTFLGCRNSVFFIDKACRR